MEIFLLCINAVVPIFIFMAVGYFCQLIGIIKRDDVPKFNTIAFNVFLTCTVFSSVYNSDLSQTFNANLLLFASAWTVIIFLACSLFCRFAVPVDDQRGVMVQAIFRSNFIMVGLQFALGLGGQPAVAVIAMMSAVIIPLNNVLAVITLSLHGAQQADWKRTLVNVVSNPLVVSTFVAFGFVLLGIQLPASISSAITQMGNAATPLMLFLLGAFFQFGTLGHYKVQIIMGVLGRLVVVPAIVVCAAVLMGFNGIGLIALVALFASPTANASFTMAQQMGGDSELAGDLVAITSVLCPLSLFGWGFLLMSMGLV